MSESKRLQLCCRKQFGSRERESERRSGKECRSYDETREAKCESPNARGSRVADPLCVPSRESVADSWSYGTPAAHLCCEGRRQRFDRLFTLLRVLSLSLVLFHWVLCLRCAF